MSSLHVDGASPAHSLQIQHSAAAMLSAGGMVRPCPVRPAFLPLLQVAAQAGCWTAIVNICGEAYQAFFETQKAAAAALEAALYAPLAAPPHSPPPVDPGAPPRRASLGALADVAAMMPTLSSALAV
jgi:hypothetical protein